jgi:hypothetical protein
MYGDGLNIWAEVETQPEPKALNPTQTKST